MYAETFPHFPCPDPAMIAETITLSATLGGDALVADSKLFQVTLF